MPDRSATAFGWQWNRFRRTQLDSHSGQPISAQRFFRTTGWTAEELRGKRVLDAGCGAGRFTEIALACGAEVVAFDFSRAVDACAANFKGSKRLGVVQCDMYALPFRPGSFDFVYCLGVLQHTPDARAAFGSLVSMLAPNGHIAVDVYPDVWYRWLQAKYWVRPITTRLGITRLFRIIERHISPLLAISTAVRAIPVVGPRLQHLIPVSNYFGVYDLPAAALRDWAILDTFDMLAPQYDRPESARHLRQWFREAGLAGVDVFRDGHLIARGHRPRDHAMRGPR